MTSTLLTSGSAAARRRAALDWITRVGPRSEVVIIATTAGAATDLAHAATLAIGASFAWRTLTLQRLAIALASDPLARSGRSPMGALAVEASVARVVHALAHDSRLGRLMPVASAPGLPPALAATLTELRHAAVPPDDLQLQADAPELTHALRAYDEELARRGLADRADVLRIAAERALDRSVRHALLDRPILLLDAPISNVRERDLVAALAGRAPELFATVPHGDELTARHLERALGSAAQQTDQETPLTALAALQRHLFSPGPRSVTALDDSLTMISAPTASAECVEIARRIHRAAAAGVPFDRIAVLLRSPKVYRAPLEAALRRAGVPAHFAEGTLRPDPSGRAYLALLACAAEGLSATRFAEYVSLGELPPADAGAPPLEAPPEERWVPSDEEILGASSAAHHEESHQEDSNKEPPAGDPGRDPVIAGSLRSPSRWERLIVDAAVIGSRDRWARRLAALAAERSKTLAALEPGDDQRERIERDIAEIRALSDYALPLIDALADLPELTLWGDWIDRLSALASRALRKPQRVYAVLAGLSPMAEVGPIDLHEVRRVLTSRLHGLTERPRERRHGSVFVSTIDCARGMSFELVLVPGLVERGFPEHVIEDPVLRDDARTRIDRGLATNAERSSKERLALHLAAGAAERRVIFSFPRLALERARPRVPSFYALEVFAAIEGRLPGFDELAARAEPSAASSGGWPAPADPKEAIDEAEYDLAVLRRLLDEPAERTGAARYLLGANRWLARSLSARVRRRRPEWSWADGLATSAPAALAALGDHLPTARSFGATALERYSACPYQFYLGSILRLSQRDAHEALEEISPVVRGHLIHAVQFELLTELRAEGLLPVTRTNLDEVRRRLDAQLERAREVYEEELMPIIERVWREDLRRIRADLGEWIARAVEDPEWTPVSFELAFGPESRRGAPRDPSSVEQPLLLTELGLQLTGSIDLVERSVTGALRATDHKTGRVRARRGARVGGGRLLQPVLYALALESLYPGSRVEGGRLYHSTIAEDFQSIEIPLDESARRSARDVVAEIARALGAGSLPAAPGPDACSRCDYGAVCGPHTADLAAEKAALPGLETLRGLP